MMIQKRALFFLLFSGAWFGNAQQPMVALPQGSTWTPALRTQYWFEDQGSKLMPYSWFLHLECPAKPMLPCPAGTKMKDNLTTYGFVIAPTGPEYAESEKLNPGVLPIGFARHVDSEGPDRGVPFVGFTCAACHSTRIDFPGKGALLIEGAPGKVDLDVFIYDVAAAMHETLNEPSRLKRFLAAANEPDSLPRLKERVRFLDLHVKTDADAIPNGYGRTDAFGGIFNQILLDINAGSNLTPEQMGIVPLDAPSSYPFIWDISQQQIVQWNGSAPNLGEQGTGSILRNVGEVLGVFGQLSVPTSTVKPLIPKPPKYQSSAVVANLRIIESWVADLRSPQWPGPLAVQATRDAGEQIYLRECSGCHAIIDRETRKYPIRTHMVPVDEVQTDRQLVDNFRLREGSAGALTGQFTFTDPKALLKRFDERSPLRELTVNAALGAYSAQANDSLLKSIDDDLKELAEGTPSLTSYKARPLDGIWATGPFLHNGSVPSLAELLKTPQNRASQFCVGSDLYDVKNVGYVSSLPCGPRQFLFDTRFRGNSNAGHAYGTQLSDADKANLLEYLKTL
jgi:mono/diheme cytochrome c family protein